MQLNTVKNVTITLVNAKVKVVSYFSFLNPLINSPARKQSCNGKYLL